MVGIWSWIASWVLTALTIAVISAIVDEAYKRKLEDYQRVGFFLIFVLPTIMEALSYYVFNKPVFYGVV